MHCSAVDVLKYLYTVQSYNNNYKSHATNINSKSEPVAVLLPNIESRVRIPGTSGHRDTRNLPFWLSDRRLISKILSVYIKINSK